MTTESPYMKLHQLSEAIERLEGDLRCLQADRDEVLLSLGLRDANQKAVPVSGDYRSGQSLAVLKKLGTGWFGARDIIAMGLASREYCYPLLRRLYVAGLAERRKTEIGPFQYRAKVAR